MQTQNSRFPLPPVEFTFAGFTWPRRVSTLTTGDWAKRLLRYTDARTGGYYHSPVPLKAQATPDLRHSFYLESDFMPHLRWDWCDNVAQNIHHTGWWTDRDGDGAQVRGLVMTLTRSRGFLAGWSMGEGMSSAVDCRNIYPTQQKAAYAADEMAERMAQAEREYQEQEYEAEREREREEEERERQQDIDLRARHRGTLPGEIAEALRAGLDLTTAQSNYAAQYLESLEIVRGLLSGVEWDSDTPEAIAEVLRAVGLKVEDTAPAGIEYSVCEDCLAVLANGHSDTAPNHHDLHFDAAVKRELGDRKGHLVAGIAPTEDDPEGAGYEEFSGTACELCNSTLAGSRHGATLIFED